MYIYAELNFVKGAKEKRSFSVNLSPSSNSYKAFYCKMAQIEYLFLLNK